MSRELVIGAVIGLVVGAAGGYFFGANQATNSINRQIAEQDSANAEATLNVFENVQTNPLEDVKTNPYESVKTNPFE